MEYLRLRTTGYCEIDIPEWMFDLDYPGMYMRRIKNISLTIPCVTGPFNGVQCRLTLLSSTTRIDPRLIPPAHRCCCDPRHLSEYELCPCDPRAVRQYAAREAIATSSGKNDSGMFEVNFSDPRYFPFEYQGAVCRLRIELPPENNYFDRDTLSDLILRHNYTAREGGELLRRVANETAQRHLPGDGWCFFDVRHDFPDAWELFRTAQPGKERCKQLSLRLTRRMFPYVPERRCLRINKIALLFEAHGQVEHDCCDVGECACEERKRRDSFGIVLETPRECQGGGREYDKAEVRCVANTAWPELYSGVFDVAMAQIAGDDAHLEARFEFAIETGEVSRVFMFCHYTLAR
jgi:hypothetical protein